MCRLEAVFRLNETTLWECPIVGGSFPGVESAEPCVEAWKHRWRLVRDASRGAETPRRRTRVPTERWSHTRTGRTWGIKDADQHLKSLLLWGGCWIWIPREDPGDAAEWILSDVGHWNWLFWVSRTWTKLRVTRNRLSLSFWTFFFFFWSEFSFRISRVRGCLICQNGSANVHPCWWINVFSSWW